MFSFNLIDEPWIPCLVRAEDTDRITPFSLSNALTQSQKIKSIIGDNPMVTVAIHRLLLAVIHQAFKGPRNSSEWKTLWEKGEFEQPKLEAYLSTHKDRFDIFDEQFPFYQTADVSVDKAVSSARLLFQDDENAALFDHTLSSHPPEILPALAARMLLVCQSFDVSGLITGENKADTATASPLCQSAVCLVRGSNLFQTLMLNLHHYSSADEEPFAFNQQEDSPAWEKAESTKSIERLPQGPIDLLTWQSRRLKLVPEKKESGEVIVKEWVKMKGNQFPKGFSLQGRETMVAFKKKEKPKPNEPAWLPVGFSKQRVLWRDSHCLLQSFAKSSRPKTINWLSDLVAEGILERSQIIPIDLFGLSTDKAKRLFWRHESLPIPLEYLDRKELVDRLLESVTKAEDVERELWSSVRYLAQTLIQFTGKRDAKDDRDKLADSMDVTSIYWSRLEALFKKLLTDLPNDQTTDEEGETVYGKQTLAEWARILMRTAEDAFQIATRSLDGSSRALKAVAIAERSFRGKLREALKGYLETDNNNATNGGTQ